MNMKDYKKYEEAYFEGTLSEAEEEELKAFLSSAEGAGREYDELRAVMGCFSVGKSLYRRRKNNYSEGAEILRERHFWRPLYSGIAAAVACLVVAIGITMGLHDRENYCVTFYKGAKITDETVVMDDVEATLAEMMSSGSDVQGQLSDFFAGED